MSYDESKDRILYDFGSFAIAEPDHTVNLLSLSLRSYDNGPAKFFAFINRYKVQRFTIAQVLFISEFFAKPENKEILTRWAEWTAFLK